ncbi:hypothetical protein SALBM217S_06193 [Streptomyces griseoloalbus]
MLDLRDEQNISYLVAGVARFDSRRFVLHGSLQVLNRLCDVGLRLVSFGITATPPWP